MADRSPGGADSDDWAKAGFTKVEPVDPSANQGDSDRLQQKRVLDGPGQWDRREEVQRGQIKPLVEKDLE